MFVNPIRSDDGSAEVSCIAYDITERKEMEGQIRGALKEKEVLLQEVHHRVKNNLQVISSMLNLQRRFVSDPGIVQVLEESQNRIATMSFIHESLYRATDFSSIGFSEYLQRLAGNLMTSYARRDCRVELHTELEPVFLNLDQAIPCGLIVNELLSNAMKYAFVGRAAGAVTLRVGQEAGRVQIEVRDDGVGLPEGFDAKTHDSLGMYLVQALTEQLDGELEIGKGPGSSFLVSFTPST
jgi:two-component sensor histidine kinase